jgi:light-independent protochlorophyllide reductase subunit B
MGLEEHLLSMFRDDPEFHDDAGASHLGAGHAGPAADIAVAERAPAEAAAAVWSIEAELELKKIPFFVRGKARRNTEAFAAQQGLGRIELATLYDAKAHYGR